MNGTTFFEKTEKYCLNTLRKNNFLSKDIDQYINEYRFIYEGNVDEEKVKMLFLICECLLHNDDEEKLKKIINDFCSSKSFKTLLLNRLCLKESLLDKILTQSDSKTILMLKITSNICEFLLNEFKIDMKEKTDNVKGVVDVKVVLFEYVIELMKVFVEQKRKDIPTANKQKRRKTVKNDDDNEKYFTLIDNFINNLAAKCLKNQEIDDVKVIKERAIRYIFTLVDHGSSFNKG